MNKEKYNQIIDEAYENYRDKSKLSQIPTDLTKEEFVKLCKNDITFSVYWGLKIQERELTTVKERKKYDRFFDDLIGEYPEHHKTLDNRGVPRKIITVTYNNEKIEIYG